MAISSKIEEIILELTKNVGNIYDSLLYGIGDETTPGSSIFEINNLISMAETGYPYFGTIETAPLGFGITYDLTNDPYYVTVKSGQVAYNGSILQTIAQKIPIKKEWSKDAMPDLERVLEFIKQPFFRRLPNLQRQFDQ